jgi:hypothetical protein
MSIPGALADERDDSIQTMTPFLPGRRREINSHKQRVASCFFAFTIKRVAMGRERVGDASKRDRSNASIMGSRRLAPC